MKKISLIILFVFLTGCFTTLEAIKEEETPIAEPIVYKYDTPVNSVNSFLTALEQNNREEFLNSFSKESIDRYTREEMLDQVFDIWHPIVEYNLKTTGETESIDLPGKERMKVFVSPVVDQDFITVVKEGDVWKISEY